MRVKEWSNGVLERWSIGFESQRSNPPTHGFLFATRVFERTAVRTPLLLAESLSSAFFDLEIELAGFFAGVV